MDWSPTRRQLICVGAVLLARLLDYGSTLHLLATGGGEANPVVRQLIAALGPIPGLLTAAVVSIVVFVTAIELLLRTLSRTRLSAYRLPVRVGAYGSFVALSLGAMLLNLSL